MRINYLAKSQNVPQLASDSSRMIRAHRDHPRHRRIIKAYRAAHPLCECCLARQHTSPTEHIHHMVPVASGGQTDDHNLLALCRECHDSIHRVPIMEQRAFKA